MKMRVIAISRMFSVCGLVAIALLMGIPGAYGQTNSGAEGQNTTKTVVITGANRGLGLEFARQYAAAGWHVIGTARRPDVASDLKALDVRVMQLDVPIPTAVHMGLITLLLIWLRTRPRRSAQVA